MSKPLEELERILKVLEPDERRDFINALKDALKAYDGFVGQGHEAEIVLDEENKTFDVQVFINIKEEDDENERT